MKRLFILPALLLFCSLTVPAERVPWTTSRVKGSPEPPPPFHVERVYPKLQFQQPVELMPLGNTGRMMLLEVGGKLYTFEDKPDCEQTDLAIDFQPLIDNFTRAYGFGVHPNFDENRQIFVAYAGNPVARPDGTRLSRFVVSEESPPRIDPESEEVLLVWPSGGHNGCTIRFDSDGFLYFSAGDGARPFPPDEYDVGQDLTDLRSTICRIDVDHRTEGLPYAIPQDNPFVDLTLNDGEKARPEIWAYGFRNPWRFTIDPETDQMLCGDVGWELWELVFDVHGGGNYGWSIYEGPQPIRSDIQSGPTPIEKPLVAYPHAVGQSVTGGVVYRGNKHEDLRGAYLYGDYVTGLLWGLRPDEPQVTWNPVLAETGLQIITFAESVKEDVLIVDYAGGIYKLVANRAANNPSEFPRSLSQTGIFTSTETLEPAPGVLRYEVTAPAWQDGATSEFVVGLPNLGTVKINRRQRNWLYPPGTVFAKTLSLGSKRVETQMLHFNGIDWRPYSYVWDEDQSDAQLVGDIGLTKQIDGRDWHIPSRAQCRACHSRQNGGAVGFTFENLDCADQVNRFIATKVIDRKAPPGWKVSSMVDPADESEDLGARARSYLTANCAHCHRRGGGGTVPLDLTYSIPLSEVNAIDVAPTQGTFGISDAKVVAPGDPYRSTLFYRMATSGTGHMPKLWMRDNDTMGLQLIHDWIESLGDVGAGPHTAAGTSESLRQFASMLSSEDDADRLASARAALSNGNAVTAPLFERFVPVNERRKRLGPNIDAAQILAMEGDPTRGRELFMGTQAGQCTNCHRLQGSGRSVGPELDGIAGKRPPQSLLESILDPSKVMEPQFLTHLVLTVDGVIVTGLKVEEDDDAVVIRTADGKDNRILKDDIESTKTQTESLMPTGLAAEMTAQELADLLAFLSALR